MEKNWLFRARVYRPDLHDSLDAGVVATVNFLQEFLARFDYAPVTRQLLVAGETGEPDVQ